MLRRAVEALLEEQVEAVRWAVEGERDATLFAACRRLAPLLRTGALDEGVVVGELAPAAETCGLARPGEGAAAVRYKLAWRRGNPLEPGAGGRVSDWTPDPTAPVATRLPDLRPVWSWAKRERPGAVELKAAIAVAYERHGWPTLPWYFDAGTKRPAVREWQLRTPDPRRAWREFTGEWADCQVGVLTGRASGLMVLDDDGFGLDPLAGTANARTRKGIHVYLRRPQVRSLRKVDTLYGAAPRRVQALCDGEWVAVPPSLRVDGRSYEWIGDEERIAPAPAHVVKRLADREPTWVRPPPWRSEAGT